MTKRLRPLTEYISGLAHHGSYLWYHPAAIDDPTRYTSPRRSGLPFSGPGEKLQHEFVLEFVLELAAWKSRQGPWIRCPHRCRTGFCTAQVTRMSSDGSISSAIFTEGVKMPIQ